MKNMSLILCILIIIIPSILLSQDFPELKGPYLGQEPPGKTPEIFAKGIISNNNRGERDVCFSYDGKEMLFSRQNEVESKYDGYDIMYTELENGKWSKPVITSFSSPGYGDLEAFFTPGGQQVFFNSKRPPLGKKGWETWFVKREGDKWGTPELLGKPFGRVCYTTFSRTGYMYYTREDLTELYRASFANGKLGEPEKLGKNANFYKIQFNAFIAPDESYLIFSAMKNPENNKVYDLFICFKTKTGTWTKPVDLGPEINTSNKVSSPYVSPDGKYFFFSSDKSGVQNIYWMNSKLIEDLKPED